MPSFSEEQPKVIREAEEAFAIRETRLDENTRAEFIRGYQAIQKIVDAGHLSEIQQIMGVACISQDALYALLAAVNVLGEKKKFADFIKYGEEHYGTSVQEEQT